MSLAISIFKQKSIKMISILLAVHNGEKYLSQSIESILNQTYTDWELLIGFNGTSDKSKDIVNQYKDKRMKIFDYGLDKGKGKTLNKLISESQYDWCAMQDDDDIWMPQKLEQQILLTKQFDVIGTYILYIDNNNTIIGSPKLAQQHKDIKYLTLHGINQIANSSSIFKKQPIIELSGWNIGLEGKEDLDLWQRLLRTGSMFANIPQYLTLHRLHKDSNFNTKEHRAQKIC